MTPVPQHSTSREPVFGCGMVSTGVNMITKNITSELSPTTNRECQFRENWDMCTDTNWKERLPETRRPGLILVIRSDYPHPLPETRGHPSPDTGWSLRRWSVHVVCDDEDVQDGTRPYRST